MEFTSSCAAKRPVRLTEETRRFAFESLHNPYGKQALETMAVSMDETPGFSEMGDLKRYDAAVLQIAERAPIRICSGEKISGAATLGLAISHFVPATFQGQPVVQSVSHLTLGFEDAVKQGLNAYQNEIEERCWDKSLSVEQTDFLKSLQNCIDAVRIWRARYLGELTKRMDEDENYKKTVFHLRQVPFGPPRSFHEAVQSLWFLFAFERLCGNWPGLGRIDLLLGDYLKKDLAEGILTLEDAREILAHFFIKGCEWITGESNGSGDAQHYQNIVLSGIDENGVDVTNEVTYLVLDIIEELGISDFPVAVRMNRHTPEKLLRRMAEVIRHGGGIVAVYNEELVMQSLTEFGYSLQEARQFANDGCWEVQVPGKTYFSYKPFDGFAILLKDVLRLDKENVASFASYEELYQAYLDALRNKVLSFQNPYREEAYPNKDIPCSVVSLLTKDCIKNAKSYYAGGARYTVLSPHFGGIVDAANSLYALKKLVFEEKQLSLESFLKIVQDNWKGHEPLRRYVLNQYQYYGNDNDEADAVVSRLLGDYMDVVGENREINGILFPPGVSTFGREIEWGPSRTASPHGRKQGEVLSSNFSPTPATDAEGATAVIKSHCKADLVRLTCGTALDIKLFPKTVEDEKGICAVIGLLRGFVNLGGFFMQMDVIDNEVLKRAKEHPEEYQTLAVRVSGWSARFVTLEEKWQDMIIRRNSQTIG